jgi:hypothetical protein
MKILLHILLDLLMLLLVIVCCIVGLVIFSLYWVTVICYVTFATNVKRIREWLKI